MEITWNDKGPVDVSVHDKYFNAIILEMNAALKQQLKEGKDGEQYLLTAASLH